ncbi:hypothetical protein CDD81_7036 [Ophiocordyceps australis]|uniref:SET domain-containing protein n=1 Tax=Ophiocordyceps australis TaxID=1399860 RepID=A0A2C5YI26_9HYPO|nr:hypothetical protein CDD81_7036 [Ophiocordyceps australis]
MGKPKNWPANVRYLTAPLHDSGLSREQVTAVQRQQGWMPVVPASWSQSPAVRIRNIDDAAHPACGQRGLFATRRLEAASFVVAYLGRVHGAAKSKRGEGQAWDTSDYDLWLDKGAGVAVDGAREGNEARFINDYRGVGARANAVFGEAWCEQWKQVCVGVWVAQGSQGIDKGQEIVVSYGKGFWEERRSEATRGRAETGAGRQGQLD